MAVKIHPTADVSDKAKLGDGTSVWHQAQIRENAVLGEKCNIGKGAYVDFGVHLGNGVKLQNYVNVYHGVTLEDYVFVGPSATFTNDMYPRAAVWSDDLVVKTLVKKGASIGANSTIRCGITIGEYATIGAGAVVTRDVPDHALAYGSPARIHGFVCECGFPAEKKELTGRGMEGAVVMKCTKCGKEFEVPYPVYRKME
ncbi:MAG: acyltransferase [Candidatus Thermoplasmatota archaeon]|nr:acyltransferase [Candidatus Thermoplasmatota archaeon]